jgi:hypothetical protein
MWKAVTALFVGRTTGIRVRARTIDFGRMSCLLGASRSSIHSAAHILAKVGNGELNVKVHVLQGTHGQGKVRVTHKQGRVTE